MRGDTRTGTPEGGFRCPESYWSGRRVLVTGAGGFVGASLARALAGRGACVIGLFRSLRTESSFGALRSGDDVEPVFGDVTDRGRIEGILIGHKADTVFHLAAEALVGTASGSPLSTFESNVGGTWTMLEACRTVGVDSVVVASSDKAYGENDRVPLDEGLALKPSFLYETSKACADLVAQAFARTYRMPIGISRCANIYGGGDLNWSRIVPCTIRSALAGERPIIRSDGTPERDYLYIDDAVEAYLRLAAAQTICPAIRGEVFNFGTGEPVSALDLTLRMLRLVGRPDLQPEIRGGGGSLAEIHRQYLDSNKARRLLDWRPVVTLEDGLRRSIGWYRSYMHVEV